MDDYTWHAMIQRRRAGRRREIFFFALTVAALIGTAIWYFGFYTKTPEYALKEAVAAVESRDAEKFGKYVNMDVLTMRAYDDLTVDFFTHDDTLSPQTRILFEKFYVLIKPQLSAGIKNTILAKIETGEWGMPEGFDILKGRQLGIDYERFLERSLLRSTEFLSVGRIERGEDLAVAEINVRESFTDETFTLMLMMERAGDGHWQAAYIENYKKYLDTITPLIDKDITEYMARTQPIVDESNAIFRDRQYAFIELTKTENGRLTDEQKQKIIALINDDVIPALKQRQRKLDAVEVPIGAKYLADLRKQSAETTIKAWQHYVKGLKENDHAEFETAETLHKEQLETDIRIEDIIKRNAISKNMPTVP